VTTAREEEREYREKEWWSNFWFMAFVASLPIGLYIGSKISSLGSTGWFIIWVVGLLYCITFIAPSDEDR